MRSFVPTLIPLSALFAGGALVHISTLNDGVRGKALMSLAVLWCLVLVVLRTKLSKIELKWILLAGVTLRVCGFFAEPFTSHDGLRYLADGAALLQGLNPLDIPYIEQPLQFQESWPVFYEHRPYTSIYPPLALALFAAAASTGVLYAWWTWKALSLVTSVVITIELGRLCQINTVIRPIFFWFALHPLLIIETTVAPHIDLFVLVPLLFWLKYRARGLSSQTMFWLGLASLIKPTILLGGLAFLKQLSKRSLAAVALLMSLIGVSILTLRIMSVEAPWGADFGTFLKGWHFGSLLDSLLFWNAEPLAAVQRISILLCLSGIYFWLRRGRASFFGDYGDLLFLSLACSPVVFPWYLIILTIWIGKREVPIIVWWSTSLLTYEVLDSFDLDTTWSPSSWPNQFTVIILILWALSRRINSFMLVRPQ